MDYKSLFFEITQLYGDYASVLNNGDWEKWPDFFTEECLYIIQSRENNEGNFPLSTLHFESKDMLKDRVYAINHTLFHEHYYQRHIIGMPRFLGHHENIIKIEANYSVFRTKPDEFTTVFNVGRYVDELLVTNDGLRFKSKLCIFDSELIPNSLIYPI